MSTFSLLHARQRYHEEGQKSVAKLNSSNTATANFVSRRSQQASSPLDRFASTFSDYGALNSEKTRLIHNKRVRQKKREDEARERSMRSPVKTRVTDNALASLSTKSIGKFSENGVEFSDYLDSNQLWEAAATSFEETRSQIRKQHREIAEGHRRLKSLLTLQSYLRSVGLHFSPIYEKGMLSSDGLRKKQLYIETVIPVNKVKGAIVSRSNGLPFDCFTIRVNLETQTWACFEIEAGGDILSLICFIEGVSIDEAVNISKRLETELNPKKNTRWSSTEDNIVASITEQALKMDGGDDIRWKDELEISSDLLSEDGGSAVFGDDSSDEDFLVNRLSSSRLETTSSPTGRLSSVSFDNGSYGVPQNLRVKTTDKLVDQGWQSPKSHLRKGSPKTDRKSLRSSGLSFFEDAKDGGTESHSHEALAMEEYLAMCRYLDTTALATISENSFRLSSIVLSYQRIGPRGCAALTNALQYCATIETLDLQGNDIGDLGCGCLAHLLTINAKLAVLKLQDNSITSKGLLLLGDSLNPFMHIESSAGGNDVIGASCPRFRQQPHERHVGLQELYLSKNPIRSPRLAVSHILPTSDYSMTVQAGLRLSRGANPRDLLVPVSSFGTGCDARTTSPSGKWRNKRVTITSLGHMEQSFSKKSLERKASFSTPPQSPQGRRRASQFAKVRSEQPSLSRRSSNISSSASASVPPKRDYHLSSSTFFGYFLDSLDTNESLELLELSQCNLNEKDLRDISEMLLDNRGLKRLDISWNDLQGRNTSSASGTRKPYSNTNRSVEEEQQQRASQGILLLRDALSSNFSLEHLDVSWNRIGDIGVSIIAKGIALNSGLRTINLRGNGISETGAGALAHMISLNKKLEYLHLQDNPLGSRGVAHLEQSIKASVSVKAVDMSGSGALSGSNSVPAELPERAQNGQESASRRPNRETATKKKILPPLRNKDSISSILFPSKGDSSILPELREFFPGNPCGRYELNLSLPEDKQLAAALVTLRHPFLAQGPWEAQGINSSGGPGLTRQRSKLPLTGINTNSIEADILGISLNGEEVDLATVLKTPDLLELRRKRAQAAKEGSDKIKEDSWLYSFPRTGTLRINVTAKRWCHTEQSPMSVIEDDDFVVFLKELQSALLSDKDRIRMCRHLSLKTMVLCKHILGALVAFQSSWGRTECIIVFYPRIADVLCLSQFVTPSLTHNERRTLYPFIGRSIVRDVSITPQGRYRLSLALDVHRQVFAYLRNLACTSLIEEKEKFARTKRDREEKVLAVNGRQLSTKVFRVRRQVQNRITAYNTRKSATNPLSFEQNWRKFVGPAHYKRHWDAEPQDNKANESLGRNVSWWETTLNGRPISNSVLDFEMPQASSLQSISFYMFLRKYPEGLPDAAPRKEVTRFIEECLLSRPVPPLKKSNDSDSLTVSQEDLLRVRNGSTLISRGFGSNTNKAKRTIYQEEQIEPTKRSGINERQVVASEVNPMADVKPPQQKLVTREGAEHALCELLWHSQSHSYMADDAEKILLCFKDCDSSDQLDACLILMQRIVDFEDFWRLIRHLDPETTNRLSAFASWRFLFVSGFRYFPAAHYKLNVADPEDRSIATELFLASQRLPGENWRNLMRNGEPFVFPKTKSWSEFPKDGIMEFDFVFDDALCVNPATRPVVNGRRHHRRASVVEGVSPILSRSVSEKILDSRGAVLFLHVMVKRVQRQFRKYLLRPDVAFRRRKRKAEALAAIGAPYAEVKAAYLGKTIEDLQEDSALLIQRALAKHFFESEPEGEDTNG